MKTTKTTKKTKYDFIVDLTNCETPEDVHFEFVRAKALAGVKITDEDFKFIYRMGVRDTLDTVKSIIDDNAMTPIYSKEVNLKQVKQIVKLINKKEPWYKRFWKWATRKK